MTIGKILSLEDMSMPSFNIITDENGINLSSEWVNATKFNSKDRIVDSNGNAVSPNFMGRMYRLIAKKERYFSCPEIAIRGFLGVLAICCSLGLALISKCISNLFTKRKDTIRFGISYEPLNNQINSANAEKKITADNIKSLVISQSCMQTSPCQHYCQITLLNGYQLKASFHAPKIAQLLKEIPGKITIPFNPKHFNP